MTSIVKSDSAITYFLIDEREKAVYILRIFHMLVDSKAKILRFC